MVRILIVDDDNDDCDFLRDAIHQVSPGTECTIVLDATDAIERLKSKEFPKPDLIFLDLNFPRVSGFQCLKEIRNNPDTCELPVVIYTASKSYEERLEALKLGATHFVTKPSSFRLLCKFVTDVLAKEVIH
jgi:CheY-like chemotaxis protein